MRIGIDASRANIDTLTGVERYAFEICSRIGSQLPNAEIRLYVREPLRSHWPTLPANVTVCVLRWPPRLLWSNIRLAWELFRRPVDVVFFPASAIPAWVQGRVVTTIHDVAFLDHPELYRRPLALVERNLGLRFLHGLVRLVSLNHVNLTEGWYQQRAWQRALLAHTIITVSEYSASRIRYWAAPRVVDVSVSYSAVAVPTERYSIPDRLRGLGVPDRYFLYIGRIEAKKNIRHLIEGYLEYAQNAQGEPVPLVLAGRKEAAEDFNLAAITRDTSAVRYIGPVTETEKWALLQQASALALVSRDEGFGLPTIEAAACRVPVMIARTGALPEILPQAAVIVDPDDTSAMAQGFTHLAKSGAEIEKSVEACARRSLQFTWDNVTQRVRRALESAYLKK